MAFSSHWQEWRFCMVCQGKFLASSSQLKFQREENREDLQKEDQFLVSCPTCGADNFLDPSLIPASEQALAKKKFFSEQANRKRGLTS